MSKKNKTKKSYFRFGILIFLWLLIIGALSYAYFSIVFSDNDKTEANVETGLLSVDFETGEYISNDSIWPINDDDIFTSGDKTRFSVTRSVNNTTDNVYYSIYLDDIVVSDNFKSGDVQWKLYNVLNPDSSTIPISEGSFANLGSNTSILLTSQKISLPKDVIHYYTLYLWISNSPVKNQIELLNGSFEGRVKIIAVTE